MEHIAQSGDVLHFVSFLRQVADSSSIRSQNLRVEGVYFGGAVLSTYR
jgi:hypothetical protein